MGEQRMDTICHKQENVELNKIAVGINQAA